jgi:homoserine dehydrogenase
MYTFNIGAIQKTVFEEQTQLTIGLFGFGCVGQGLFDVLQHTKGINGKIAQICVKNPNKNRKIPAHHFCYDKNEILYNPDIDVVIELIDDEAAAYDIVTTAMREGKAVISANKKLIANHLAELLSLQKTYNVPFLYEASVCGSIPIIRNLEEYYNTDLLSSVSAICNGTTNYILTKTAQENLTYHQALKQAQALGFAESDPTLDVQGFDAKYKLILLALHAFGQVIEPEKVLNYGIQYLNIADSNFAKKHDFAIKLLAKLYRVGNRLVTYVAPHFLTKDSLFYNVQNEFNAVEIAAQFAEKQFFIGKGAGSHPTASAVLSDLAALRFDYRYEYKNIGHNKQLRYDAAVWLKVYVRYAAPSDLLGLNFRNISEKEESHEYSYLIGEVSLQNLIDANLNHRENIFIAFFE